MVRLRLKCKVVSGAVSIPSIALGNTYERSLGCYTTLRLYAFIPLRLHTNLGLLARNIFWDPDRISLTGGGGATRIGGRERQSYQLRPLPEPNDGLMIHAGLFPNIDPPTHRTSLFVPFTVPLWHCAARDNGGNDYVCYT